VTINQGGGPQKKEGSWRVREKKKGASVRWKEDINCGERWVARGGAGGGGGGRGRAGWGGGGYSGGGGSDRACGGTREAGGREMEKLNT